MLCSKIYTYSFTLIRGHDSLTEGKVYAIQFLGPCIEPYIPYVINTDTSMVVKRDVWRNKYQVIAF